MSVVPSISIVMPVYNGEKYLEACLESVMGQTHQDFELIVINDGSSDRSHNILQRYAAKDRRVKLYVIENSGPGEALNFGVAQATGKYLCFIDQDDMMEANHLEVLHQAIVRYDVPVVFGRGRFCAEDGMILEKIPYPVFDEKFYDNTSFRLKNKLRLAFVPQWIKIVNRDFWQQHSIRFPKRHNKAHDVPVHIMLVFFADNVAFVNRETYIHRIHSQQITNSLSFESIDGFRASFIDIANYCKGNGTTDKALIRYTSDLLYVGKQSLRQKFLKWQLLLRYVPVDAFKRIFFLKKETNNYKVTRVLFLKFKSKIKNKNLKLFHPQIRRLGRNTYAAKDLVVANPNETRIGSFCSIGERVVLGHGDHPVNFLSTSPYFYFDNLGYKLPTAESHNEYWNCEPINIGNDVWIGDGVFVKNGVNIGDGAIVGARSVVTKDVPPYSIVVGCPARVVKYRFDEETVKSLLELHWWDLPDDVLKALPYSDIKAAMKILNGKEEKK